MLKISEFARLGHVSVRTLRFYDELGLLSPSQVDPFTGYRQYSAAQLPRLNRILVLKDLGLSLDEIAHMLHADLSLSKLRAVLQQKQRELEQHIQNEQARLHRVEARLQQIEQEALVPNYDIVLKRVEALAVATLRRRVRADHEVEPLITEIYAYLRRFPIAYPAPALAVWDDQDRGIDEEHFDVEVAVPVHGRATSNTEIEITVLPAVEAMACAVHHGSFEQLSYAYQALHDWSRANGYRVVGPSRTIYVHMNRAATTEDRVIEVQLPVILDERLAPFEDLLGTVERVQITERVRQVLLAAYEKARQQADAVQLQHLLLGLLYVEKGLAAAVLTQLGISEARVRGIAPSSVAEPEIVVGGQRWSQPAREIVAQSAMVAQRLRQDYIGTEHLLLALAEQRRPDIQGMLESLGLTASLVEQALNEQSR